MNTFTVASSMGFAWEVFKKRTGFFIGVTALVVVAAGLNSIGHGSILAIVAYVAGVFVDMGLVALFLKAHDSVDSVTLKDLWHPQPFWNYLGATLLVGILTVFGLILLIIPGLICISMWVFVKFLIIERQLGPIEAMKESARVTKGNRMNLLILVLVVCAINILGAIPLFAGLLVSIPVSMLALTHAYRTFFPKTHEQEIVNGVV